MTRSTSAAAVERAPIGWGGVALRDMLDEGERRFAETGHYWGTETLSLKESDPIRYERLYARIRGTVVSSREAAMRIAASPLVREMGELCFALYTPEGDSIAISAGIIVHVHTMSEAIKYMVRSDYESNPGIRDRDIFVNNDPQISNVHNADIQTFVPIFAAGELLGWVAAVTHEFDVGARTPGAMPVGPTSRLEDGLDLPAIRCGENDVLFRDYVERCQRGVRTPFLWSLDEKTRLAGCHMIRADVLELVEAEGADVYKQLIREVVEEGRRSTMQRVRTQLVPGVYRTPAFIDYQFADDPTVAPEAARDGILHAPVTTTIERSGRIVVSLDGANGWGYHAFNCTESGMCGAWLALLAELLLSNEKMNDGAYLATRLELPVGSWSNSGEPMTAHSNAWYALVPSFVAAARALSRAHYARGYVEEVVAGWGDGNYLQGGSVGVRDVSVVSNMEPCCVGGGAGIVRDGLDYASCSWTPTSDMGEVEDWEMVEPLLYLGRTAKPNSAGLGRRRGGMGFDSLRMVWTDDYMLQSVSEGAMFGQAGLFGGYPAAAGYRHYVRDTDLEAVFARRDPYPVGESDPGDSEIHALVDGDVTLDERATTHLEPFGRHDLYLSFVKGGPGLGDPLEREPEDVARDLHEGVIRPDFAHRVYGVVGDQAADGFVVDGDATERRRAEIRTERAERAVPVREWIAREREERVLPRKVIAPVADMYRSTMELSSTWAREYREFWSLDDEFAYER